MENPLAPLDALEDATEAMNAWAELCEFGMRMALATEHGTPEEKAAAW